jgi:hypothetical protein
MEDRPQRSFQQSEGRWPGAKDRRAAPRLGCPSCEIVAVAVQPRFTALVATLRDVSTTGIGLVVEGGFGPWTVLALRLPEPQRSRLRIVLARIIHVAPHSTGGWIVVCALDEPFAEDELRACLL